MNLVEGLVRLFDNNLSMEMAKIGVDRRVVDLYAVQATEVLHSQTPPISLPPEDGTFTTRLQYSDVMVDNCGDMQYIDNCDPNRWSKLEVKLGVDVTRLEYYYLKLGISYEGLVILFDNISSMEMVEIGVQNGVVDVYAVQANEVLVSQLTQENVVGGVGIVDNVGMGTVVGTVGGDVGGMDALSVGEFWDEDGAMASVGGEIGVGDRQVDTSSKNGNGKERSE